MLSLFTLSCLALRLVSAQRGGQIIEVGSTKVSAMMVSRQRDRQRTRSLTVIQMFVGNEDKVYILDKVENNAARINGHPAWASEWSVLESGAKLFYFMEGG
jgi:hypothetical protein